jgi:type VI secretion system protein
MSLTLTVQNIDRLSNGMPVEFVLHRRGAFLGRSPACDWSLPDPQNHVSSRHCEIHYQDNGYWLTDISTNGTFMNGAHERMAGPKRLVSGDRIVIGDYEILASLSGSAAQQLNQEQAASAPPQSGQWAGWDNQYPAESLPSQYAQQPAANANAQRAEPAHINSRFGDGWTPAQRAPDAAISSVWEDQAEIPDGPSGWSSAAPDRPANARPDDVWGRLAEGYVVDWARGGFHQNPANPDPLNIAPPTPESFLPPERSSHGFDTNPSPFSGSQPLDRFAQETQPPEPQRQDGWAATEPSTLGWAETSPPHASAPPPSLPLQAQEPMVPAPTEPAHALPQNSFPPAPSQSNIGTNHIEAFFMAAGINPDQMSQLSDESLSNAGALFRQLISGLVVMVEARARAKAQMGAETTTFEHAGNNPIKFARTPEQAILQLIKPQEPGFMDPERAVEDAFYDLQSHQIATLKAMQGALRATLERFSPHEIKKRATVSGIGNIITAAHEAKLWRAYEKEFSGVAQGSDEAFMDVFAKEFRKAYETQSQQAKANNRP